MEVKSIKQFAEEQNVSYEAIRRQTVRYSDELKGHIVKKNRTQFLDEWAIDFLLEKRKENPVIVVNKNQREEVDVLRGQIDILKSKLLVAQEQIISLQAEVKKSLEAQIEYTALLEESKAKDENLKDAERKIEESEAVAEEFRRQVEADRKTIEDLQRERDEAKEEAKSYTKSIFGFYRKK